MSNLSSVADRPNYINQLLLITFAILFGPLTKGAPTTTPNNSCQSSLTVNHQKLSSKMVVNLTMDILLSTDPDSRNNSIDQLLYLTRNHHQHPTILTSIYLLNRTLQGSGLEALADLDFTLSQGSHHLAERLSAHSRGIEALINPSAELTKRAMELMEAQTYLFARQPRHTLTLSLYFEEAVLDAVTSFSGASKIFEAQFLPKNFNYAHWFLNVTRAANEFLDGPHQIDTKTYILGDQLFSNGLELDIDLNHEITDKLSETLNQLLLEVELANQRGLPIKRKLQRQVDLALKLQTELLWMPNPSVPESEYEKTIAVQDMQQFGSEFYHTLVKGEDFELAPYMDPEAFYLYLEDFIKTFRITKTMRSIFSEGHINQEPRVLGKIEDALETISINSRTLKKPSDKPVELTHREKTVEILIQWSLFQIEEVRDSILVEIIQNTGAQSFEEILNNPQFNKDNSHTIIKIYQGIASDFYLSFGEKSRLFIELQALLPKEDLLLDRINIDNSIIH